MKSQKHKPSFWEAQLLEMLATNTLPGKNVPTCVWQHPKLKKNQKWYQKQGGTKGWELRYGLSSIHPDKMNSWKQKVKIWKMMKMNFPFSIRWFWGSIIILSGSTMITMMIVSHDHANDDEQMRTPRATVMLRTIITRTLPLHSVSSRYA